MNRKPDIKEYIESLINSKRMSHQVAYHKVIDGHEGAIADTQKPLPEDVLNIIHQTGGDGLYRHQAEAIDLIRSGKNVVVATPTASGKTLIYNLPVMERMLINNDSRADTYFEFLENQVSDLIEHMSKFDAVVGFNIKRFDYKVLGGYSDFNFNNINTIDILEKVH
ncbi:MAG: DEAD/DEAH box helicase [Deltaproteobacteria bacterium]|nr:DEAD/DEAH box helicase [Deltaproteobacteria bacterium]